VIGSIMIRPSQIAWILLAASLSLGISGCGHSCTGVGCPDGLSIFLDGTPDPTAPRRIEVSEVTATPEVVLVMTCSLSTNSVGGPDLLCSSARQHSEHGNIIVIRDYDLKHLVVTVSSGGTKLGEQTFDPTFTSEEINGPGCGVCSDASIRVMLP